MREIASRGLREERRGIESYNQIKDTCKWPRKDEVVKEKKRFLYAARAAS